jgi:predicted RNase H-like HicB family nuclease
MPSTLSYNYLVMHGMITIVYQENPDGWITSSIPEYPGAISQGKTREEAREMVLDALNELMVAGRESGDQQSGIPNETLDFEITAAKSA